ncbi:hypothetical protein [Candidatus Oleimmundimicrobium sp.]|uniref:hypothetical protein n=1 Tax=Candidatus Oleimmundimicrobium sp. TaxID=3060597 RepID=UPI00272484EC|nr:hypothetical protein [Candidatus Oleimmundimicrobium sp.]MDO8886382.1 hypothetical protein [Candidatus Oleimmundimicrobium sp.]
MDKIVIFPHYMLSSGINFNLMVMGIFCLGLNERALRGRCSGGCQLIHTYLKLIVETMIWKDF